MTDRPRLRTLCGVLLGAWLAFSVAMTIAATVNFARLKPEHLPEAPRVFAPLGDDQAQKVALRYTASELNRVLFDLYGRGQIVLGLATIVTAIFVRRGRLLLLLIFLALVAAVLFEHWLVPAITDQGRIIDFLPREPKGPEVLAFDRLHRISVWLDGGKMLILAAATALLCLGRGPREAGQS